MKTETMPETQACIYQNGVLAMEGVLSNPDILTTVVAVSHGGDNDVRLTLSKKSATRVQIVAYGKRDKNDNIDADAWAEWDCCQPDAPVARMHQKTIFDTHGRAINDLPFSGWIPASAAKTLEWVAQVALEKRAGQENTLTPTIPPNQDAKDVFATVLVRNGTTGASYRHDGESVHIEVSRAGEKSAAQLTIVGMGDCPNYARGEYRYNEGVGEMRFWVDDAPSANPEANKRMKAHWGGWEKMSEDKAMHRVGKAAAQRQKRHQRSNEERGLGDLGR